MNDFSQNALAFNCGLIALKKFDMWKYTSIRVKCHLRGFHSNNSCF